MFRIGDFSRFTCVSVKALRHYDRLGLLAPAFVDPVTHYRWYAAHQVSRVHRIRALRDLGFSLERVADLIQDDPGGHKVRRLLGLRRAEIRRQVEGDVRRLAQLDALILECGERARPTLPDAEVHELSPLRVAARRARVRNLDDGAEALFEAVEADAASAQIRAPGPPLLIYHDVKRRHSGADIEAAVPVVDGARSARGSTLRTLAAQPAVACVAYRGGYEQWAAQMRGLMAWIRTRRLRRSGPTREVFLQFAARDPRRWALSPQFLVERASDFVTEIQIPVRRR